MTFAQVSETGHNSSQCCLGALGTLGVWGRPGWGDGCLFIRGTWSGSHLWGFEHGTSWGRWSRWGQCPLVLVSLLLLIHQEPSLHSPPPTFWRQREHLRPHLAATNFLRTRAHSAASIYSLFLLEEDLFSPACINSSEHSWLW